MDVSSDKKQALAEFVRIAKTDPKVELECKLLSGRIQTKNAVERILQALKQNSDRVEEQEPYLTVSYPDQQRITVNGVQNIQKLCYSNSFRGVPLTIEKKQQYGGRDVIEIDEIRSKFTLRKEIQQSAKDSDRNPNDPKAHMRLITRKSFYHPTGMFRIDVSMVKSKDLRVKTVRDLLKQPFMYELEIEFVDKQTPYHHEAVANQMLMLIHKLLAAYYETKFAFLLLASEMEAYRQEFKTSGHRFYDVVTLTRKHLIPENPHNIVTGDYTVTIKADGERSGLFVSARDRRVIKIDKVGNVVWTGITATDDTHAGDFLDGEYVPDQERFCIFDVYQFRKRDTKPLPLLTTDDGVADQPLKSRLGCAKLFIEDLNTSFQQFAGALTIETKEFVAGTRETMQEAIRTIWEANHGFKVDGLIFTPRSSAVAPISERIGDAWLYAYKWKPPSQNSIDFLLRMKNDETYDTVLNTRVRKGELYVSRSPKDYVIYPRETMNQEYKPKLLPGDMSQLGRDFRIPSIFQPSMPMDPDAYHIFVPLNEKNVPVDEDGHTVEDNTIVECAYDTENKRWTVMRTRYEKTYQYRVQKAKQYGNDVKVADNIWRSIHYPVTIDMLTETLMTKPTDELLEDMYYSSDVQRPNRAFKDAYAFHLRIKDSMYREFLHRGDLLLELAVGRGGDLPKWRNLKPSKVVGMDLSLANLNSPMGGAASRYVSMLQEEPDAVLPPVLFIQGDMTSYPLFQQADKYMPILRGEQAGSNPYLDQFNGVNTFDVLSCQFAMHYACESEETFRNFAKNVAEQCKGNGVFFGTCSDGQEVYALLSGKTTHHFKINSRWTNETKWAGDYTKKYMETGSVEFGMPVEVLLESFEKPATEYLVPFDKITAIFDELGFELVSSKLFSSFVSGNLDITRLTPEERTFSSLNRTFAFRKRTEEEQTAHRREQKKIEANTPEFGPNTPPFYAEQQVENIPELSLDEEMPVEEEAKQEEPVEEEPKKRKLRKQKEAEPEPILFSSSEEAANEYRDFSNASPHAVTIDGTQYPTVEHYYQAMKATEFGDADMLKKIIKTKTAKAVKSAGKKVQNFNQEVWDAKKEEFMRKGVRAKFVQHPAIQTKLLETGDKLIGFADARDTFWAIGTSLSTEKAKVPSKWRGENRLGKLLMELRDEFSKMSQ